MPAPPFRSRSHSWPFQNTATSQSEVPHITVKIAPAMNCVPVPLRMALTWTIFTKTLNRLYTALQSNQDQFPEFSPVTTVNEMTFKVYWEDTSAEITSEQWTRALQPDMVIIVEFVNPRLPPTFLVPGLENIITHSGRRRASHLQLNFIPSPKGFEKHPGSAGRLSGPGSPSLKSPTLPSINELSSATSRLANFSSSNTRILRKVQNGRTVVGSQDGNMRTHWDDSAQMMDTSDEDNSAYPSSSGSPQPLPGQKQDGFPFESFRVSHFERPRPPTRRGSDPESEPRSISEADEYDREEEDGSEDHYSNDSMIWGPSGGVDDGMEGIEMEMEMDIPTIKGNDQKVRQRRYTNAFGNANAPFSPRYRSLSGNIQHYHCQMNGVGLLHPEHNQDRQQHIYQTQPFSSESSLSSSEGGAATNYNDTTRVTRWDRVQGRQENVAIMPTTVIATTTPPFQASKRKRGCNENDTDVESAALPTKRAFLGVYTRFI